MEPGFHNTTRWRAHEFLLVTILILTGIAGYIRPTFEYSTAQLADSWGRSFADAHLSFDYLRNVLFPNIGFLLLLYCCYCWINLYIMPRLMQLVPPAAVGSFKISIGLGRLMMEGPGGIALKKVLWGLLNTFLLTVLLGIGWGIAYTYTDAPAINSDMTGQLVVGLGLEHITGWVIGYIVYAFVREMVIRRMQQDLLANANLISVVNQVSGYLLLYFAAGGVLLNFNILDNQAFGIFYFVFLPPALLTALTNLYWVFPLKGDGKLWRRPVLRRLLISSFCWGIPFIFFGIPNPGAMIPIVLSLGFAQLLVTTPVSWLIYRQWKDKILQVRGLQTALGQSEADLQFLRSQINPHFLFNVLNTLYGTALQEEAARTAGGIQRLGDMMRFMLHENHLHSIPMSKEIEYLKNYIVLQQLRTESSESIAIETTIDEAFPEFMIAPMLLIPFVENGFKHGISLREPSWIKLRLNVEGNRVLFELRNSIHASKGADPEKERSGIGLKNVLKRLSLLYPNRHEFYMHQDEREFFVQLSIQP